MVQRAAASVADRQHRNSPVTCIPDSKILLVTTRAPKATGLEFKAEGQRGVEPRSKIKTGEVKFAGVPKVLAFHRWPATTSRKRKYRPKLNFKAWSGNRRCHREARVAARAAAGAGITASMLHIAVRLNAKPTDVRRPTVPRGLLIQIKANVR